MSRVIVTYVPQRHRYLCEYSAFIEYDSLGKFWCKLESGSLEHEKIPFGG